MIGVILIFQSLRQSQGGGGGTVDSSDRDDQMVEKNQNPQKIPGPKFNPKKIPCRISEP